MQYYESEGILTLYLAALLVALMGCVAAIALG